MKIEWFKGRISRSYFFLSVFSIGILMALLRYSYLEIKPLIENNQKITGNLFLDLLIVLFFLLLTFLLLFFLISIFVRRWHDLGRSGWLVLLSFIPGFGFFIVLLLALLPGNSRSNKYGKVPLGIRF